MKDIWKAPGRLGRLGAVLCAAVLLLSCGARVAAVGERPLRVAFPLQDGLAQVDEDGNYSGYTYEYLQEIAQYTGWSYEFVTLDGSLDENLTEMLEMLERGELDLMGAVNYSDALAQVYDYPGLSYGTANLALAALKSNTAVTESNYQLIDGLRIAVPEGSTVNVEQLERFCQSNRIQSVLVPCKSEPEMIECMERGGADVALWIDLLVNPQLKTIAKFSPRAFYFATTKGNTGVVNALNTAIMKINESDPYFAASLYDKYFGGEDSLALSDEEISYAGRQDALRVAFVSQKAPIQYADEGSGEFRGVAREVFDYIAGHTGLSFTYVPTTDQSDLIDMLTQGRVDLIAGIPYDYENAELYNVALTRPYLSSQMVMVVNSGVDPGDLSGRRLALPMGVSDRSAGTDLIVRMDTVEECILAVDRGEADFTFGNGYSMQFYANRPQYKNIAVLPWSGDSQNLCIGVSKPADVTLLTILNKAVLSIPDSELQSMLYRNAVYIPPVTLRSILEANPGSVILAVVVLALMVIGALLWYLHTRADFSRRLAKENARYQTLCELSNEYLFEYDFLADRLTLSEHCARMFRTEGVTEHYRRKLEETGEDRRGVRELLDSVERGREAASHELTIGLPDGTLHRFRITMKITRDSEGRALFSVGKLADIQEEWEARTRLEERAQRDSLTGVLNAATCRQVAVDRLEQEEGGALLLLDIDRFKQINDEHGHFTGDQVLTAVAGILAAKFRSADVVGRPGGDEFFVFMSGVSDQAVVEEKCRAILAECAQLRGKAAGISVTMSIGVAMAEDCRDYGELYRRADRALYRVKKRGRDGYAFAEEGDGEEGEP